MERFNKYIPTGLLVAYVTKMLITGSTLPDMGILLGLISVVAISTYMEKNETIKEMGEALKKDTTEMRQVITKQNEALTKMAVELDTMRTSVTSVKMGQNFRAKSA